MKPVSSKQDALGNNGGQGMWQMLYTIPVIPNQGSLPSRGELPTSGDIFGCHSRSGCYWHLVGRSKGCYLTSYNTWSIQYVSKSGRLSSGHRTGKGQFSSQFPRRMVLKNVLTIGQLHSSLMLVRLCLKSCMLGFSIMQTKNFLMSKLGLEKEEEPEIKLPTFAGS